MPSPIRRVVTGHDAEGRSIIVFDGPASNTMDIAAAPGARVTELWVTSEMPVDNDGHEDRGARPIRHDPDPTGTIFRVVEVPSESDRGLLDLDAGWEQLGSTHRPDSADRARHPGMHVTDSIDYVVVMSGEMHMLMEDGEVLLKSGDCVVQRGTKHAWVNRGSKPCLLAVVLVDAKRAARA